MRIPVVLLLTALGVGQAVTAHAWWPKPYVRTSFVTGRLLMKDVNEVIISQESSIRDAGHVIDLETVGPGNGWGASGGLWLLPDLRVGAVYSTDRSIRKVHWHDLDPFNYLFFGEDLNFRMEEAGLEAALRIPQLWGLTLGGTATRGTARFVESQGIEDSYSYYGEDATAGRTKNTYSAFFGLDQTNEKGWVGYVQGGYRWRDMGSMPMSGVSNDGVNFVPWTTTSVPVDYSGMFVRIGLGWDFTLGAH